jgi:hypothetical protein
MKNFNFLESYPEKKNGHIELEIIGNLWKNEWGDEIGFYFWSYGKWGINNPLQMLQNKPYKRPQKNTDT